MQYRLRKTTSQGERVQWEPPPPPPPQPEKEEQMEEEEEEEDQEVTVSFSRYEQAAYVAARTSLIQTGAPPLVSNDLWDGVDPVSMAMDELSLGFLDPSLKIIRTMPDGSIQEVTPVHDPASGDMWMEEYRSNSLANSCTRGSSYYKHTAAGTAYKAIVEEMVQSLCLPSDEAALILEAFAEPAAKEDEDTDHPCPDEPVMMANCALQTLKPWVPEDTAFQESYDPESNYLLSDVAQDASDARDESTAEKAEQDGSLPDWGTPSQVTQSQVTQSQVTQSQVTQSQVTQSQVTQSQVTSLLTYTKESIIQSILHKGGCHNAFLFDLGCDMETTLPIWNRECSFRKGENNVLYAIGSADGPSSSGCLRVEPIDSNPCETIVQLPNVCTGGVALLTLNSLAKRDVDLEYIVYNLVNNLLGGARLGLIYSNYEVARVWTDTEECTIVKQYPLGEDLNACYTIATEQCPKVREHAVSQTLLARLLTQSNMAKLFAVPLSSFITAQYNPNVAITSGTVAKTNIT